MKGKPGCLLLGRLAWIVEWKPTKWLKVRTIYMTTSRWWFQRCLYFLRFFGRWSILTSIFFHIGWNRHLDNHLRWFKSHHLPSICPPKQQHEVLNPWTLSTLAKLFPDGKYDVALIQDTFESFSNTAVYVASQMMISVFRMEREKKQDI